MGKNITGGKKKRIFGSLRSGGMNNAKEKKANGFGGGKGPMGVLIPEEKRSSGYEST